jgi:predicted ATP-binding protein involved in virulence
MTLRLGLAGKDPGLHNFKCVRKKDIADSTNEVTIIQKPDGNL